MHAIESNRVLIQDVDKQFTFGMHVQGCSTRLSFTMIDVCLSVHITFLQTHLEPYRLSTRLLILLIHV